MHIFKKIEVWTLYLLLVIDLPQKTDPLAMLGFESKTCCLGG